MGAVGEPSIAQPRLYDYGIQTENSDIRCHVAPGTRLIFVFQTASALALDLAKYKKVPAYQPGVQYPTAEGYLVPPSDIPDIRVLRWNSNGWWSGFDEKASTSDKGAKAVAVVSTLLRSGRFPLWLSVAQESGRLEVQRGGTDILLWGRWKIQVKCDFWAGKASDGSGTGNLFLQVAELNPLRRT